MEIVVVLNGDSDNAEVVEAVNMTYLCRELHVLPYAGGLYEQPWIVVELMKMAIEAQNEKQKRDQERRRGAKQP